MDPTNPTVIRNSPAPWAPDQVDASGVTEAQPEVDADLLNFAIETGFGKTDYIGPNALARVFQLTPDTIDRAIGPLAQAYQPDVSEYRGARYPITTAVGWLIRDKVPVTILAGVRQKYEAHRQEVAERPAKEAAEREAKARAERDRLDWYRERLDTLRLLARMDSEGVKAADVLLLLGTDE